MNRDVGDLILFGGYISLGLAFIFAACGDKKFLSKRLDRFWAPLLMALFAVSLTLEDLDFWWEVAWAPSNAARIYTFLIMVTVAGLIFYRRHFGENK